MNLYLVETRESDELFEIQADSFRVTNQGVVVFFVVGENVSQDGYRETEQVASFNADSWTSIVKQEDQDEDDPVRDFGITVTGSKR